MNVFLDTSAVIKLYHKEVGSDELLAFLNTHAHERIELGDDASRSAGPLAYLKRKL